MQISSIIAKRRIPSNRKCSTSFQTERITAYDVVYVLISQSFRRIWNNGFVSVRRNGNKFSTFSYLKDLELFLGNESLQLLALSKKHKKNRSEDGWNRIFFTL